MNASKLGLATMDSRWTVTDAVVREIATALAAGAGKWTGCDWSTQFGDSSLDLRGFRASQALLMARATAGIEAADWRSAVDWLRRVEQDAREAENEAQAAARLAADGRLREALECVQRACAVEARYRVSSTWQPLHDVIVAAFSADHETIHGF